MSDDSEIGELGNRVAHALRSPLGVVAGVVAQMRREVTAPSLDGGQLVEFAERGLAQLGRIADRLALLGAIEQGLAPGKLPASLRVAVVGAIDDIARTRRRKAIEVVFEAAGEDASIVGDAALLRALVAELVDNGVRFARHFVRIDLDAVHGVVSVRNDGPAVDPNALQGLCGTRARHGDRSGLGLGLWLAARIAEVHGGSIEHVESPEGPLFRLSLRASPPRD